MIRSWVWMFSTHYKHYSDFFMPAEALIAKFPNKKVLIFAAAQVLETEKPVFSIQTRKAGGKWS